MSPMTMAIALDFLCQEQRLSFSIRVDCGMLRILRWEKRPASMLMRGVLLDATLDLPVQGDGQLSVGLPIRHDNEVNLDEPLPPDQEVVRNDANPAEQQLPVMKQKPATIDPASMCYSSSTSDSRSRWINSKRPVMKLSFVDLALLEIASLWCSIANLRCTYIRESRILGEKWKMYHI